MPVEMKQLFAQVKSVPQIPEVIRTIIIELNNPDYDTDVLIKNISQDQALSLKVLRLVNSAHMGLRNKINSIDAAVITLGTRQLKTLTITSGFVAAIPEVEGLDLKKYWQQNFRTANYAKWIATELDADAELVFTAGLIHNIGIILFHLAFPKEASEINRAIVYGQCRPDLERRQFGFTSSDVSAEICRQWKLPEILVKIVEHSEDPSKWEAPSPEASIIHIASYISQSKTNDASYEEMISEFPMETLNQLNLTPSDLTQIIPQLEGDSSQEFDELVVN